MSTLLLESGQNNIEKESVENLEEKMFRCFREGLGQKKKRGSSFLLFVLGNFMTHCIYACN